MKNLIIVFAFIVFACTESNQRISSDIRIGDKYQGGIVFYLFKEGDVDYIENETHGLIAKDTIISAPWGCKAALKELMIEEIGYGNHNSNVIIDKCNFNDNIAFQTFLLGYFAPNRTEFKELIKLKSFFDLGHEYFWVSSKHTVDNAFIVRPNDGYTKSVPVYEVHNVIPIKKF